MSEKEFNELLKIAFAEYADNEPETFEKNKKELSKKDKLRINKGYRIRTSSNFAPFPEVDNTFERIRAKILIFFKKMKKNK